MSTLLCARAASAQLLVEVQRKTSPPVRDEHAYAVRTPRSAGAEKTAVQTGRTRLRQFVCPAQPVLKRLPPGQGEPPPRFRSPRSAGAEKRKEQTFNHLLSGNSILAELLLLCACSLRLLAALYARAFIMLTLAELGKRTRLGTRTLEATQCAVNRLIFLDADLRHSFPSLRTFPSWGSLSTVCIHPYTKP